MTRATTAPTSDAATRPALLGLPRAYWLLWVGMLVNRLGGTVFPFLAIYLTQRRGLSRAQAGLVVATWAVGGCFGNLVGGALADRLGRRPTLVLASVCSAAAMLALGFADRIAVLLAIAPVLGFFTDQARPALQAMVADVVAPAERLRAYGLLYWALNLGFAGAAATAGALAQISFTWLFVVDAATTLAFAGVVIVGLEETAPTAGADAGTPRRLGSSFRPFRNAAFLALFLIQLPVLLVFQQGLVSLALDMVAHGIPTASVGALLGLNGVAIVLLQPLALRGAARLARVTLLALGAACTGLGFGAFAFVSHAPGYAAAIVAFTLGEIGFSMATPALVADLAPPHERGSYQGGFGLAWAIAGVAAPTVGPWILERAGPRTLWIGCAAVGLAAAWLHLAVTARFVRRR